MFKLYKTDDKKQYNWEEVGRFEKWEDARDKALENMGLEKGESYDREPNGDIRDGFIGYKKDVRWKFMILKD